MLPNPKTAYVYPDIPHAELGCLLRSRFEGEGVSRIFLFGSRARGAHRPDSDYDLLFVTKDVLDVPAYRALRRSISRYAIDELGIIMDIFIRGESEIERYRAMRNLVVGQALQTGIEL